MAKGMLGGILGDEEEKPEVEAQETLAGAEAFASAVAAKLAGNDPEVARDTSAFLKKQAQLLETQNRHLEDEHALRIFHLRNQLREEKIRRFGLRLRVGFQIFIVLVATVMGIFGAVLIHDAVTSRSVVIEPFETPHALAERGLTGTVVASGVLDQLTRLQAATRSSLQRRNLSNAWSKDVKLTVPETGISIGEISQLLKARFSNDIHISGDVVQTKVDGLDVTVRGDGLLPHTFTGASDQLAKLSTEAAEYVYSQSQPALWAVYLVDSGRYQEAIEFCQASIGSSSRSDQPVLLTHWAIAIAKTAGIGPEALGLVQRAIALQPDYWVAYDILMTLQAASGDEEAVWKTAQILRKSAGARPGRAPENTYIAFDVVTWDIQAQLNDIQSDSNSTAGVGTYTFTTGPFVAADEALLHDPAAAEFALQGTKSDPSDPSILPTTHWVRGVLATEAGDIARAVSEMEALLGDYSKPAVVYSDYALNCWAAPAEEAVSHPDRADAILRTAGGPFVDCYRFHGDILDGRGDWKGAQEWYAKSIELAPDLPAGYYSWGMALARHDDLAGAEAKLKDANRRGPHWADPLNAWGDVLVKQGKTKEALAKYNEALKYAPNWKQLKEAREAVAKQKT
jgi:tetratricopeptide (TPR) repeat protein